VVDPNDTNVLYVGGVAGGVWKSVDRGASWTPLTDTFANVGVSSIAIDPSDSRVVYVGTGEGFANRTNFEPTNGVGIMKTTDAGATWRILPATIGNPDFRVVHDLVVSTNDPDRLYAATTTGISRSTDGGGSWEVVLRTQTYAGCPGLAIRTDRNPDVLLAACSDAYPDGVYRSADGGDTWTKVIAAVEGETAGAAAVEFAPSNQDIAYASVARTIDSPGGANGTLALLRSEDGGQTWTVRNRGGFTPGSPSWLNHCPGQTGQGYYGNVIAVDPSNPDRIWLGGVDSFRSDDGGRTITVASYWWLDQRHWPNLPVPSPWVHADFHAIVFDPGFDGTSNQTVYFGTDGGVFRTQNALAPLPSDACDGDALWNQPIESLNDVVYEPLNDGLTLTQFWGGTVSGDGTVVFGGTQDNGTWLRPSGAGPDGWSFAMGGDGFDVAISPGKELFYGEWPGTAGIAIGRSTTGQLQTFQDITDTVQDVGLFVTPFTLAPSAPGTIWTGGHFMWRSQSRGDPGTWVQVSPLLVTTQFEGISAIAVAPSDAAVVYAGSSDGQLFTTRNGTASPPSWSAVRADGYVSAIAVHPADPRVAYATVASFGVPHVLKTTDGGATWHDVGADLPDVPANAVAVNPRNPAMVFVGTDAGVFESPNGGGTWLPANGSMTTTIVQELVFRTGTSDLYVFTHGRGVFRVDVGA
jgi:photosystem II stability/assembly factor-like uncharacterized protein